MNDINFIKVNKEYLLDNINKIKKMYSYPYYILDVSNHAFGAGMYIVNYLKNQIDYLYVRDLKDAILIRKYDKEIPIIYNGFIHENNIYDLIINNVILVINRKEILDSILSLKIKDKFDLILNIDLNNYNGIYSKHIIEDIIDLLKNDIHIHILGIQATITEKNYHDLKYIINPLKKLDLIILNYEEKKNKIKLSNAILLDSSIYGINQKKNLFKKEQNNYKQIFSLNSKIIHIKREHKNKKEIFLGIIPYGSFHGMSEKIKKVYIQDKLYPIRAIQKEYSLIEIDSSIKVNDIVEITSYHNPLEKYINDQTLFYLNLVSSNLNIIYDDYILEKDSIY